MNQFTQTAAQDAGLARHMNQIFSYMSGGVALSGLVAYMTVNSPALLSVALNANWIFLLVWFGFGLFMHKIVFSLQPKAALGVFAAFSAMTGFSLAPITLVYTGASVATAFFTASAMFAGAALYGYTTKKSLSGWGNFLMMGAWGLIAAMLVNLAFSFFGSGPIQGLNFMISLIAVPLFAAMTAYDTNNLKEIYYHMQHDDVLRSRTAIMGACQLYMNFVVMFIHLLQLMGQNR